MAGELKSKSHLSFARYFATEFQSPCYAECVYGSQFQHFHMPNLPPSYLDKLNKNMHKMTGLDWAAKTLADIYGAAGLRELAVTKALHQSSWIDQIPKALRPDQFEISNGLSFVQTEQLQRMLGLHRNSIAEQYSLQSKAKQKAHVATIVKALEGASRPAWIDRLQFDLLSNSGVTNAALDVTKHLSSHAVDALRQTDLWRGRLSAFSNMESYLGPAALGAVQRILGTGAAAEVLAQYEQAEGEFEGDARAALDSIQEAVRNAGDSNKLLVLVNAIQDAGQPVTQSVLFVLFVMFFVMCMTPVADHYIKKKLSESPQESSKAVQIRAADAVGELALLSEYRFVTAEQLKVREGPRSNAHVVAALKFGQAVRVVRKGKDFTLISWSSSDGSVHVRGWVFSRYLRKFK